MGEAGADVTGVVLCGGRGSRMGGVDKGLQPLWGQPLVAHALARLRPQVGPLLINANRSLLQYAAFGVPVLPDLQGDFAGPLAGWLAALQACTTPWLLTVPCDTPLFPADLAQRLLGAATSQGGDIAMAVTTEDGRRQRQPVFTLLRRTLAADLALALEQGERKIDRWAERHALLEVDFDDAGAFFNANTLEELAQLSARPR